MPPFQEFTRQLECPLRLLPGHTGEVGEKRLQRLAGGQVVDEVPHRDPGADKHLDPAQDLGIGLEDRSCLRHGSLPPASNRLPSRAATPALAWLVPLRPRVDGRITNVGLPPGRWYVRIGLPPTVPPPR